MYFISPTKGKLAFEEMVEDINNYISQQPGESYRLIIGTDSQQGQKTCFVTAIIIHREGKGACYYYRKTYHEHLFSLRHRIFEEAGKSLDIAMKMIEILAERHPNLTIEIHMDIGQKGRTSHLIKEVIKMITASGFEAKVKPFSYGATKVADRYTKSS